MPQRMRRSPILTPRPQHRSARDSNVIHIRMTKKGGVSAPPANHFVA
jgi:hypothetical protein